MISAVNKYTQRRKSKAASWSHEKEGNFFYFVHKRRWCG